MNKTIHQVDNFTSTLSLSDQLLIYDVSTDTTNRTTFQKVKDDLDLGSGEIKITNIEDSQNDENTNLHGIRLTNGTPQSTASGTYAMALGHGSVASGNYSFAEGRDTQASDLASHAEGWGSKASGQMSHAEGIGSISSGFYAHAEGQESTASGMTSHAEGYKTKATIGASHAEGSETIASGNFAHSQNIGTIAASTAQTALGKYNIQDSQNTYAVILGNGASTASRSNAMTVDWNGNGWLAGDLTLASSHAVQPEFRHYKTSINANRQIANQTVVDSKYYLPSYNYFLPLYRTSNAFTPEAIPILDKGLIRISGNCNIIPASTACFDSIATNTWQGVEALKTIGISIFVSTASDLTTYSGNSAFPLIADEYEIKLPLIPQPYNSRIPFDFTIPTRLINADTIYLYGFLNSSPWSSQSTTPSTASTNFSLTTGFTVENIYATELSYNE